MAGGFQVGAGGEGEDECGDRGIACAGDVEHFAGCRRDLLKHPAAAAQEEAVLAQGDDDISRPVALLQAPADLGCREGGMRAELYPGQQGGLAAIWGDEIETR